MSLSGSLRSAKFDLMVFLPFVDHATRHAWMPRSEKEIVTSLTHHRVTKLIDLPAE